MSVGVSALLYTSQVPQERPYLRSYRGRQVFDLVALTSNRRKPQIVFSIGLPVLNVPSALPPMENSLIQRMGLSDRVFRCDVHIAITARKHTSQLTQYRRSFRGRSVVDLAALTSNRLKPRIFVSSGVFAWNVLSALPRTENCGISRVDVC